MIGGRVCSLAPSSGLWCGCHVGPAPLGPGPFRGGGVRLVPYHEVVREGKFCAKLASSVEVYDRRMAAPSQL